MKLGRVHDPRTRETCSDYCYARCNRAKLYCERFLFSFFPTLLTHPNLTFLSLSLSRRIELILLNSLARFVEGEEKTAGNLVEKAISVN